MIQKQRKRGRVVAVRHLSGTWWSVMAALSLSGMFIWSSRGVRPANMERLEPYSSISSAHPVWEPRQWMFARENLAKPGVSAWPEIASNDVWHASAGTYEFRHGPWCRHADDESSGASNGDTKPMSHQESCLIHFPHGEQQVGAATTPGACLLTKTGDKGYVSSGEDDAIRSMKSRVNQDHVVLVQGGQYTGSSTRVGSTTPQASEPWFLAALFDGHGEWGHVASYIAVTTLPVLLLQALQSSTSMDAPSLQAIVQRAFDETDRLSMDQMPNEAGSTAVVVWQQGTKVHVASVGDSTAMVVQWFHDGSGKHPTTADVTSETWWGNAKSAPRKYRILASAVQHKPGDPLERKYIEANGGTVYVPFNPKETSRVVYEMQSEATGAAMQMSLAMSRSLGDADAKRLHVVSANCSIISVDLLDTANEASEYFIVLASDGVVDMVDVNTIIDTIGVAMFQENGKQLYSACRHLLNAATAAWSRSTGGQYRDDMSLVVQRLTIP